MLRSFLLKVLLRRGRSLATISGENLNEKFYQNLLRHYEADTSITVHKAEKKLACEKGTNFVSQVHRVCVLGTKRKNNDSLEYKKALIIKELPPPDLIQLYRSNVATENESNAYNKIIPALKKYAAGPLPVPECIYADDKVTILEDLTDAGFQPVGKAKEGLTLRQCETLLEGIAKIHAASFVLEREEPKKFEELTKLNKEILFHGGDSVLLDYQKDYIENVIQLFVKLPASTESQKAIKFLQDLKETSRYKIKEFLSSPRKYSAICHGDVWAGNIMFNEQSELKLVDLQQMRYNSVASDLAYLLYVNLLPELRQNNMGLLLEHYLYALQGNIKAKGVCLDDVLTKQWLEEEMSEFALYGVIYGMWIMPAFFTKKEDAELSKEKIRNTVAAVENAEVGYEQRLKDLIFGYLRNLP